MLLAYSIASNLPGMCNYKRIYTPAAAGLESLIGYYINPQSPPTGIEEQWNDYLNGKNIQSSTYGADIYLTIDTHIEKILLQNFSIDAPIDNNSTFQTDRGSVIVSDPTTGEILGIVSEPGYDANCVVSCTLSQLHTDMLAKGYDQTIHCTAPCTLQQFQAALSSAGYAPNCEQKNNCNQIYLHYLNSDPEQPLLFRPTQACYPPGSTYKTVTLMAALDSGALSLEDQIFYNDPEANPYPRHLQAIGPINVGSGEQVETLGGTGSADISNITGYTHLFPVSLAYGYSHSDNIIFAEAGVRTGSDTWLKYNHSLYVGQVIPFDLPVKVSTVTPQPQANLCSSNPQTDTPLTVPALAEDSFGQGKDFVTPFQMMLVDNIAADDGKLMRPTVISKITDHSANLAPSNQTVFQSFSPTLLSQPISASTAQGVRDAMYGVNECGSGSLSKVKLSYPYTPWSVIGKTGTAQVPRETTTQGGDSWYITQAPYVYQTNQIPRITITAMKEHGGEGAYANGPMLNQDYEQIFTQVLKDVQTPAIPPGDSAGNYRFCYNTGFLQQ